jgi:hypothetical protein
METIMMTVATITVEMIRTETMTATSMAAIMTDMAIVAEAIAAAAIPETQEEIQDPLQFLIHLEANVTRVETVTAEAVVLYMHHKVTATNTTTVHID